MSLKSEFNQFYIVVFNYLVKVDRHKNIVVTHMHTANTRTFLPAQKEQVKQNEEQRNT